LITEQKIVTYLINIRFEMKQIKYSLFVLFVTFHTIAFSQQQTDSIQTVDSLTKKLSKKELIKEKDNFAKNLTPIPDKSIVFIVRTSLFGMAIPLKLDCDSFEVGWIHSKTYLFTIVDPGEHIFKASSENDFTLKINLEPGKIYYFDQEAKMGIAYAETKIKMINEEDGKKYLLKCSLSKHNRYPLYPKSKKPEKDPSDNQGQVY
jgi:hypothetical protein